MEKQNKNTSSFQNTSPQKGKQPADKKQIIQGVIQQEIVEHSGPLPHPQVLARYDEILPGAAERILLMAEEQAKHRQGLEKKMVLTDTQNSKIGLFCAFIIVMTAIIAGSYLIYFGREVGGLTTIITAIVAVVGPFIYRQVQSNKQEKK